MRRIVFSCLCAAGVATAAAAAAQESPPAPPPPSAAGSVSQPSQLATPSAAGATDAELRAIIEAQQRRLDAQDAVLAEQQRALEQLRNDLNVLRVGGQAPASQPPAARIEPREASFPGLTTSAEEAAALDWPGSFAVPGTASRLKIGGFAEFDAIYDNNAITTPTSFVTSAIVTRDATLAQGEDGQMNFSVQPSRLTVEWRTPLSTEQRLKVFFALDFFGNSSSASNAIRVREAYGEATNVLFGGDLILGQTWATFRNTLAVPATLDFQGPNALLGVRHPIARWTKKLGTSPLTLKIGVEAADKRAFENTNVLSAAPDGAVALSWITDGFNLQASAVVRHLRASTDEGSPVSAFGWGASLAGRIYMPSVLDKDFWTFSVTYGKGIGSLLNDAPLDASYDIGADELKALPALAYYVAYQHWWTTSLYSVICYSELWQDTFAFQEPTAYEHARYASLNLTVTPSPPWLFGIEGLYGSREDNDGEEGWDARVQFTSRFIF